MMHKAWNNIKELPQVIRQISRSHRTKKLQILTQLSVISRSHGLKKNDDLNLISVGLLGRSQLSNSSDLPCFGLYAYFSNEPFQCILRWTGTLYLFKMAWLSKVAKLLYGTILIYPISLDFFRPDNVYSPCPFVFLTATSSSINTPCLPACLSVCLSVCPSRFVSALSDVILLGSWSNLVGLCVPWDNISADFAHRRCSSLNKCLTS